MKDVLHGSDEDVEKFDVDMFLHLSGLFNLSVSQTLEIGKIGPTHYGRASIPNLEELLKNHNTACKDQF